MLFRRQNCLSSVGAIAAIVLPLFIFPAIDIAAAQQPGAATTGRHAAPKRALPPGMEPPKIDYRDIAAQAGLTGVNISGSSSNKVYIVESTGTGVAVFDYDKDGLQDILFVNAEYLEKEELAPVKHYLYRNKGNLKFEDVTEAAGIDHTGWAQGVCVGDADDDGNPDVMIPQWGQNVLYRNKGDGTFTDVTKKSGLTAPGKRWSSGCAFLDHDRDGDLDLFVANYLRFDPDKTPKPGEGAECRWKGIPVLCGPRGLPGESMSLYENDGSGNFTDITEEAGIETDKNYYGFTPLVTDLDGDGWVDVYVTCDSTASLLFHNQQDGSFEEIGVISGTAYNVDGQEQAGMGATAADFDGDGDFDIFKTNFSNDTHTLYLNEGDTLFTDETVATGLAVNTQHLGWGTAFIDVDQDGWKDLFVANGHVYPGVDKHDIGEKFFQSRLLYWNRGDGQFHDMVGAAGPGIAAEHSSRGIAIADLDNDGTLEIVTVNMHQPPSLLKNFATTGNSILVEALMESGRAALGAKIDVTAGDRTQSDEVRSGGYHISHSDFRVHFGLGDAEIVDIAIRWPDGEKSSFSGVPANTWVVITEADEKPEIKQKFTRPATD